MTRLQRLVARLRQLTAWPECAGCGRRHDPREHYPLHDDTYDHPHTREPGGSPDA